MTIVGDAHNEVQPQQRNASRNMSLEEKIVCLAKALRLDSTSALRFAQSLPDVRTFVPEEALPYTEWYAFPSYIALAIRSPYQSTDEQGRYCAAVTYLTQALSTKGTFILKGKDVIDTTNLRRVHHTHEAVHRLWRMQGMGDVILAPLQLGKRFAGETVEMAMKQFAQTEYGVCSLMGLSAVLTSSEIMGDISFTMPGDDSHDKEQHFPFDNTPYVICNKNRVIYGHCESDRCVNEIGTASFFVPPTP